MLINAAFRIPPLLKALKVLAKKTVVDNAEKNGVLWRDSVDQL